MQPTGDQTSSTTWQPPLEADPADAQEQTRDLVADSGDEPDPSALDPEAPLTPPRASDLDLTRGSEADLAEQLYEVPYDDDGER